MFNARLVAAHTCIKDATEKRPTPRVLASIHCEPRDCLKKPPHKKVFKQPVTNEVARPW